MFAICRPAGAGRPAGRQRHQGYSRAAVRAADRARDASRRSRRRCIKRIDGSRWQALCKPAKRLAIGDTMRFGEEGNVCLLGQLDAHVDTKAKKGEITLHFPFMGPCSIKPSPNSARCRCRLTSPSKRAPDEQDAPTIRRMFAVMRVRLRRRRRACISRRSWSRHCRARHRAAPRDAACRRRHVPADQDRRHRRSQDARRMGRGFRATPPTH